MKKTVAILLILIMALSAVACGKSKPNWTAEAKMVEDAVLSCAEKYGVTDIKADRFESYPQRYIPIAICYLKSEQFGELSDEDKLLLMSDIEFYFYETNKDRKIFTEDSIYSTYELGVFIECGEDKYTGGIDKNGYVLSKNGYRVLVKSTDLHKYYLQTRTPVHDPISGGNSGGSSGGQVCPVCNGTGYVKYYYGSSDLEAVLSGHDPYTTGPCTSCNGTGRIN